METENYIFPNNEEYLKACELLANFDIDLSAEQIQACEEVKHGLENVEKIHTHFISIVNKI